MSHGSQQSVVRSIQTLYDSGSATGISDRELVERFLSRQDEAAFAALVVRHGPLVWSVCRGISSDSHAAEDAFQATFLILLRKARSIRRCETIGPWLHGVARRVAVRAKATVRRRLRHEERGAEMKTTANPDAARYDEIEVLHQEIGRLPEKYRTAVVLCHLEGYTHAEAARALKCPPSTVGVRVSRARELLRARLERKGLTFSTVLPGALVEPAVPVGLAESTTKVAMQVAAGRPLTAGAVSSSVIQLTEGVVRTMSLTKVTMNAALVIAAGSVASGLGLLSLGHLTAPATARQAATSGREAAGQKHEADQKARARSIHNLRTIALAMHNFASKTSETRFPPAAIRKDGKPLLSWRVAILPYLDQKNLYDKFHLDEPWDSPHNKTLLNQMPDVYAPVTHDDEPPATTYYQVFTGNGALFEDELGPKVLEIKDGSANTLMVVEGASPVPWTKPEDILFDKEKPLPKLGGQFGDGFHVSFANGAALFLAKEANAQVLRSLITSNGGEIATGDMLSRAKANPPKQ